MTSNRRYCRRSKPPSGEDDEDSLGSERKVDFEPPVTWEALGPFEYNRASYYDFSGSYGTQTRFTFLIV